MNVNAFVPDFNETEERKIAPEGEYELIIFGEPQLTLTRKDQTPQLVWQFRFKNKEGSPIFHYTQMKGKSAWKFMSLMSTLTGQKITKADAGRFQVVPQAELLQDADGRWNRVACHVYFDGMPQTFAGREIKALVGVDEYEGRQSNVINKLISA